MNQYICKTFCSILLLSFAIPLITEPVENTICDTLGTVLFGLVETLIFGEESELACRNFCRKSNKTLVSRSRCILLENGNTKCVCGAEAGICGVPNKVSGNYTLKQEIACSNSCPNRTLYGSHCTTVKNGISKCACGTNFGRLPKRLLCGVADPNTGFFSKRQKSACRYSCSLNGTINALCSTKDRSDGIGECYCDVDTGLFLSGICGPPAPYTARRLPDIDNKCIVACDKYGGTGRCLGDGSDTRRCFCSHYVINPDLDLDRTP